MFYHTEGPSDRSKSKHSQFNQNVRLWKELQNGSRSFEDDGLNSMPQYQNVTKQEMVDTGRYKLVVVVNFSGPTN